jgi:hypothetical protein
MINLRALKPLAGRGIVSRRERHDVMARHRLL